MKINATQRTHSWLREQGYTIGTVERFVSPKSFVGSGHRRDLFGAFDLIAVRPGEVLAVQSTGTDWSGHWKKLTQGSGRDGLLAWIQTGQPALLIGWRELRTGWTPRIHYFLEIDLLEQLAGETTTRHRTYQQWKAVRRLSDAASEPPGP